MAIANIELCRKCRSLEIVSFAGVLNLDCNTRLGCCCNWPSTVCWKFDCMGLAGVTFVISTSCFESCNSLRNNIAGTNNKLIANLMPEDHMGGTPVKGLL